MQLIDELTSEIVLDANKAQVNTSDIDSAMFCRVFEKLPNILNADELITGQMNLFETVMPNVFEDPIKIFLQIYASGFAHAISVAQHILDVKELERMNANIK